MPGKGSFEQVPGVTFIQTISGNYEISSTTILQKLQVWKLSNSLASNGAILPSCRQRLLNVQWFTAPCLTDISYIKRPFWKDYERGIKSIKIGLTTQSTSGSTDGHDLNLKGIVANWTSTAGVHQMRLLYRHSLCHWVWCHLITF